MIRGKKKTCPFGLSIPFGCKTSGGCISMMSYIDHSSQDQDEALDLATDNWEILLSCETVSRCPYADVFVTSGDKDVVVDCKFDPMTNAVPAGNVGLNGSPLYPNYYVGDINIPLKGGPSGYMSDDNNSSLYFGELFTDLIKGLV
tara:strand:+ start:317 stop:751 length:435 start_codon:yes stop_codon:yes gene_type:complete